jgi:hypothetical protein
MTVPVRLAAFAVAVAAALGLGFAVGDAVGPLDDDPPPASDPHDWHER